MKMFNKRHTSLLIAGVLMLGGAQSVLADIAVIFNTNPTLQGTVTSTSATTADLLIEDTGLSTVEILSQEVGGSILDIATISNANPDQMSFDVALDLDLIRNTSGTWTAAGTFMLTDIDTSTPAFSAAFTSTSVSMVAGSTTLEVQGILAGNSPILVNRPGGGPDWTYNGEFSSVNVANAAQYEGGSLFAIQFNTGASNLDHLLGETGVYSGGKIEGTVVPEPTTAMLGLLGLSFTAYARRRRA